MKKKLLIGIIAIVLVASVTGACFALYSVNATPRSIPLGINGDGVTLVLTTTPTVIALNDLAPDANKQLSVTLTASDLTKIVGDRYGKFTLGLSANSDASKDTNLLAALDVYASGTYSDENHTAFNWSKAEMTAGIDVSLNNLPSSLTLTFDISNVSKADFKTMLNGVVDITLIWAPVAWALTSDFWYAVGTMNSWNPAEDYELSTDTTGTYRYKAENVYLTKDSIFKIRRGVVNDNSTDYKNANNTDAVANGDIAYEGNDMKVVNTGHYNIYVNQDNNWSVTIVRVD